MRLGPGHPVRLPVRERRSGLGLAAVLALAAGLAGLAGCRGAKASSELERQLTAQLATQLGDGARVSCPGGQPPQRCLATIGGARVPIALTAPPGDVDGEVRWRLEGLVVSGPQLERQVSEQLAALGVAAVPSCGPTLQPVAAGDRVRCQLPQLGVAWATVHADGSYALELALGEAAAARSQPTDEAQLDELSRALDREQGTGEGDGSDDAADDGTDDGTDDGEGNDPAGERAGGSSAGGSSAGGSSATGAGQGAT